MISNLCLSLPLSQTDLWLTHSGPRPWMQPVGSWVCCSGPASSPGSRTKQCYFPVVLFIFMLLIEPLHFALKVHQLDAFNLQHLLPPRRRSEVRPLPSHQNPRDSLVKKTMFVENYIRDVGNGFIQILITFSSKLIFCICPRQDYSYLVFLSAYLDEHLLLQISKRQRVTRTTITGTDDQAFRGSTAWWSGLPNTCPLLRVSVPHWSFMASLSSSVNNWTLFHHHLTNCPLTLLSVDLHSWLFK